MGQDECRAKVFRKREGAANQNKWRSDFIANLFLLASGLVMSISGLAIQIHYHIAHTPGTTAVLLWDRTAWHSIHAWASACFLFIVAYHVRAHGKWYKIVFKRNRPSRSRPTVILAYLMAATAVFGIIPLLISFSDSSSSLRFALVEIHDKVAVVFLIAVFLHTLRRLKWYGHVIRNKF